MSVNAAGFVVVLFYATELLNTFANQLGALTTNQAVLIAGSNDRILAISLLAQWGFHLLSLTPNH